MLPFISNIKQNLSCSRKDLASSPEGDQQPQQKVKESKSKQRLDRKASLFIDKSTTINTNNTRLHRSHTTVSASTAASLYNFKHKYHFDEAVYQGDNLNEVITSSYEMHSVDVDHSAESSMINKRMEPAYRSELYLAKRPLRNAIRSTLPSQTGSNYYFSDYNLIKNSENFEYLIEDDETRLRTGPIKVGDGLYSTVGGVAACGLTKRPTTYSSGISTGNSDDLASDVNTSKREGSKKKAKLNRTKSVSSLLNFFKKKIFGKKSSKKKERAKRLGRVLVSTMTLGHKKLIYRAYIIKILSTIFCFFSLSLVILARAVHLFLFYESQICLPYR